MKLRSPSDPVAEFETENNTWVAVHHCSSTCTDRQWITGVQILRAKAQSKPDSLGFVLSYPRISALRHVPQGQVEARWFRICNPMFLQKYFQNSTTLIYKPFCQMVNLLQIGIRTCLDIGKMSKSLNLFLNAVLLPNHKKVFGEVWDRKSLKTGQPDLIITSIYAPSLEFGFENTYFAKGHLLDASFAGLAIHIKSLKFIPYV